MISILPSPVRAMKRSFSAFHCENLVEFLEVKPMNMCHPFQYCSFQKFLKLAHTQPPAIHQSYHLNIPTSLWLQWILLQVSRSQLQLCGFACLSRFGGGSLPCNLSSLMSPRKAIDFELSHFFFPLKTWVMSSKFFTCRAETGSPHHNIKIGLL